jgi:uncharacterized LabA/DUF88 family protein
LSETRLKFAVFIDFDNIEIGVKTTLGSHFDVGAVLEAIKERGEVVTKVAYGDWTRAGDYSRSLTQHAIHMVQRNLTPGGDKNGADINLALDALEMAFTHSHINAFVIVGGDSDFMALVEKLKQYDRKVFIVGGRAFTSHVLQKNCHEFIAYENIIGRRSPGPKGRSAGDVPIAQAVPLMKRALKVLVDREATPQLGALKSTLLQLDSTFSEREYGASSFRDFIQKLAKAGYVVLRGTDRSLQVWWRDGEGLVPPPTSALEDGTPVDESLDGPAVDLAQGGSVPAAQPTAVAPLASSPGPAAPAQAVPAQTSPQDAARNADGLRFMQKVLMESQPPRWPLYVRQVKQLFKTADPEFDERHYGFAGVLDALRHCQKAGLLRLERDRVGVLRVFAGPELTKVRSSGPSQAPVLPQADVEDTDLPDEHGEADAAPSGIAVDDGPAMHAAHAVAVDAEHEPADEEEDEPQPTEPDAHEGTASKTRRKRRAPAKAVRKHAAPAKPAARPVNPRGRRRSGKSGPPPESD